MFKKKKAKHANLEPCLWKVFGQQVFMKRAQSFMNTVKSHCELAKKEQMQPCIITQAGQKHAITESEWYTVPTFLSILRP